MRSFSFILWVGKDEKILPPKSDFDLLWMLKSRSSHILQRRMKVLCRVQMWICEGDRGKCRNSEENQYLSSAPLGQFTRRKSLNRWYDLENIRITRQTHGTQDMRYSPADGQEWLQKEDLSSLLQAHFFLQRWKDLLQKMCWSLVDNAWDLWTFIGSLD